MQYQPMIIDLIFKQDTLSETDAIELLSNKKTKKDKERLGSMF